MKKILSLLFALALSLGLTTFALAEDEFDPTLTVTERGGTMVVTLVDTEANNRILAERRPTLTVPCSFTRATVTAPDGTGVDCTIGDGRISFVVTMGGAYKITRQSAPVPPTGSGTAGPSTPQDGPAVSYPDVKSENWYYEAVCYVTEAKLMTGTAHGFEPDAMTTRAMLWTILARMDGADTDGADGAWYASARRWAIGSGVSDGTDPNGTVTREQLAVMLYRYAKERGLVAADAQADLSAFADGASLSPYAVEAMRWAVAVGIVNGMSGRLAPQGAATRAQMAAMLMRYAGLTVPQA